LHFDREQSIALLQLPGMTRLVGNARLEVALRKDADIAEPEPNLQADEYDRTDRGKDANRVQLRNSARPR
jgi:hypothetical protein